MATPKKPASSKRNKVPYNNPTLDAAIAALGLLDAKRTATILCTSEEALAQERRRGRGLPFVKVGRRGVRYLVRDIEAALTAGRVEPRKDPPKPFESRPPFPTGEEKVDVRIERVEPRNGPPKMYVRVVPPKT